MSRRALVPLLLLLLTALLILAGCGVELNSASPLATPAETATPDPILLYMQAGSSQSTAQAAVATAAFFGSQLTATVQQHEWDVTSTWSSAYMTATQQAWNATATANSIEATSTAEAQITATAVASAATQSVLDVTATADWANGRAYATAMAGQAESVQMAVERERMTNQVKAIAPWVVTALAFVLALVIAWRWSRIRIIPTGQPGDKPLLLDVVDGVVTDLDLSTHPQAGTRREDMKRLAAPSPEAQAQVKTLDQMLDLGTRGTGPTSNPQQSTRRRAAAGMMSRTALPIPAQVKILPPDQAAGMVRDVIPAIVRDATGVSIDDEEKKL